MSGKTIYFPPTVEDKNPILICLDYNADTLKLVFYEEGVVNDNNQGAFTQPISNGSYQAGSYGPYTPVQANNSVKLNIHDKSDQLKVEYDITIQATACSDDGLHQDRAFAVKTIYYPPTGLIYPTDVCLDYNTDQLEIELTQGATIAGDHAAKAFTPEIPTGPQAAGDYGPYTPKPVSSPTTVHLNIDSTEYKITIQDTACPQA